MKIIEPPIFSITSIETSPITLIAPNTQIPLSSECLTDETLEEIIENYKKVKKRKIAL